MFMILGQVFGLFFSLYASTIIDKLSKKKIVLVSELILAVVAVGYATLAFMNTKSLSLIFTLQIISSCAVMFKLPSVKSWLVFSMGTDFDKKMSKLIGIRSMNGFVFLIVGGLLTHYLSFGVVFLIDALSYFVSFAIQLYAKDLSPEVKRQNNSTSKVGMINDLHSTIKYLLKDEKVFLKISFLFMLTNIVSAPLGDMLPLLIKIRFNSDGLYYSIALLFMSLGGLLSGNYYMRISKSKMYNINFAISVIGFLGVTTYFLENIYFLLPILFVIGFLQSLISINFEFLLGKTCQKHYAKSYVLTTSLSSLLIPAGLYISSLISMSLGIHYVYLHFGVVLLMIGLLSSTTKTIWRTINEKTNNICTRNVN